MNDILNGRQTAPKVMDKKHPRGFVHCVAIAPDNSKVFSTGGAPVMYIHDTQTYVTSIHKKKNPN
jgi:hypothetical protein